MFWILVGLCGAAAAMLLFRSRVRTPPGGQRALRIGLGVLGAVGLLATYDGFRSAIDFQHESVPDRAGAGYWVAITAFAIVAVGAVVLPGPLVDLTAGTGVGAVLVIAAGHVIVGGAVLAVALLVSLAAGEVRFATAHHRPR